MPQRFTIGIDLGGTNLKAGVCAESGHVLQRRAIETEAERGAAHVLARMVALVDMLLTAASLTKRDVLGIGVGSPGPLSPTKGMIYRMCNLPGWDDFPLRDQLSAATGLPVTLENDANAAAYGEFVAGAGRDVRDLVMLTLGTGIGGGIVLNGRLVHGYFENAAEIGHVIIVPGGRPCPCGQRGCLERYASANAVAERFVEAVRAGEASALASRIEQAPAIDAEAIEQAATAGDVLAGRIWDETCYYLALAAINLQHLVNPQLVVLGGGLAGAGERLLTPVRAHFERERWRLAPDFPEIVLATLGNDAGIIGAAALAREICAAGSEPRP